MYVFILYKMAFSHYLMGVALIKKCIINNCPFATALQLIKRIQTTILLGVSIYIIFHIQQAIYNKSFYLKKYTSIETSPYI